MSGRAFLDTNLIVYAYDRAEAGKRDVARRLLASDQGFVVSTQVLMETYVALTRKLARPVEAADAEAVVKTLIQFEVVNVDASIVLAAVETAQAVGISLWDAAIIEAAKVARADVVLSEDLNDGQDYGGIVVRNPFSH